MFPSLDQRNKLKRIQDSICHRDNKIVSEHITMHAGSELLRRKGFPVDLKISNSNNFMTVAGIFIEEDKPPLIISGETTYPYLLFFRCAFSQLLIQNTTIEHIVLIDCVIHGDIRLETTKLQTLQFKDVHTTSLIISRQSSMGYIHFKKEGNISGEINCSASEIDRFWYEGSSYKPKLMVNETKIKNLEVSGLLQYISLKNSTIGNIDLYQEKKDNLLHNHHTAISNSTVNEIRINNFNQGHFFVQSNCKIEKMELKDCIVGHSNFKDSIISQASFTSTLCSLFFEDITMGSCNLEKSEITELQFKGGINGKYFIDQSSIGRLNFLKSVITRDGIISFASTNMNSIIFEQLLSSGQLQFKEIQEEKTDYSLKLGEHVFSKPEKEDFPYAMRLQWDGEEFDVNSLTKDGTLGFELWKTPSKPQFKIFRSSMGKAELIGCNLTAFDFHYCNSKLLEMFFAGTSLPFTDDKFHTNEGNNQRKIKQEEYQQKISLYSQLKKIFDGQGNIIEGSLYHSRAMVYQQKLLSQEIKTNSTWKSWLLELRLNTLAFQLNKISNNHGESWWRSLWFTAIITLLTFVAATWSMKYHFSPDYLFTKQGWQFLTDLQLITDIFFKLPGFFLPTHKLEYLSEGTGYSPTFAHYCWDIISRIFIGYGIYQFISAFRRHSRKGA